MQPFPSGGPVVHPRTMNSSDWDERYAGADLVWSAAPNVWVEELLDGAQPGRALDVAAGEGRNAIWLVERGWTVTATDSSPVAVSRMRQIADDRLGERRAALTTEVSDATRPPPAPVGEVDAAYDLVLFCYLHLPREEWDAAIAAGVRAAAPAGLVFVVAHALRNLVEGVGGPQDPTVLLDPEGVVQSVTGLPVDVVSARIRERMVEGSDLPALDTVVVLRRVAEQIPHGV